MTITLFLMTQKGFEVLKAIVNNKLQNTIDTVIVGIDRSVENDYSHEIINLCKEKGLKFFLSDEEFKIDSEYSIAISWRWIIKAKNTLIVLHDSLLPKYRGFAPLVNALVNNEKRVGVTALFASNKYDRGDIILQKSITINYPIKIKEAIDLVSKLYCEIVVSIVQDLNNNTVLTSEKQNESNATYSLWRDYQDYFIDWNKSSEAIKRFIDAVGYPYLGAKSYLNEDIITVKNAQVIDDVVIENRDVGKVIFMNDEKPIVVCGKGLLQIEEAVYENNNFSALPLKKFRSRFK